MYELEHPLRARQIAQPDLSQLQQPDTIPQLVTRQVSCRLGDHDLAAVRHAQQPCSTVHRRAEVVIVAKLCHSRVKSHAHPERLAHRPVLAADRSLAVDGCAQRGARGCEHSMYAVASTLHNLTAVSRDRFPQDHVMARQRHAHRMRLLLPQPRRHLEIGEQERHRPRRQLGHPGTPSPLDPMQVNQANWTTVTCRGAAQNNGRPKADWQAQHRSVADDATSTRRQPAIQHDIAPFLAPVETIDGVRVRFGPVFTKFVTADLMRTPTSDDQQVLAAALDTIEDTYEFAPGGALTFVAYGLPYFRLLPRGLAAAYVPRLLAVPRRLALEEAIPAPTDVTYRFGRRGGSSGSTSRSASKPTHCCLRSGVTACPSSTTWMRGWRAATSSPDDESHHRRSRPCSASILLV